VVPLDPRSEYLERVAEGRLSLPRASSMGSRYQDEGDPEVEAIIGGEPPRFEPELEEEGPEGFWGRLGELGGVQGEVNLRESGPIGALVALGGLFANVKAMEKRREQEGRKGRNAARREQSERLNMAMEQRDRALRLKQLELLGQARRAARGEDAQGQRQVYVPGAGYVPASSGLGQRYLTRQAETAGTPLSERWKPEGESEAPRPSPTVTSIEEQEAESTYKALLNRWRANYWWQRSGGSPENYATWANSPMPTEEMEKAEASPEIRQARDAWRRASVLRVARNARSQEDLDDLEAALERAPAEVRSDPRVLRAVHDAAARVR
jgi:hypothetical protein